MTFYYQYLFFPQIILILQVIIKVKDNEKNDYHCK